MNLFHARPTMKLAQRYSLCSFALIALAVLVAAHAAGAQRPYLIDLDSGKVTAIGSLGNRDNLSEATALNDSGQVVGMSWLKEGYGHAFVTGANGVGITDLGTLGGDHSRAAAINNAGQVVGSSDTGSGSHAFLYSPGAPGLVDLGTLGGRSSSARAINNTGRVVGGSSLATGEPRGFITAPGGGDMRDLGTLTSEDCCSSGRGINDAGQVLGTSGGVPVITGPDGQGMRSIGGRIDFVNDINGAGQVVGWRNLRGFITGPNGQARFDLGSLSSGAGEVHSIPNALNDAGQVVGYSRIGASVHSPAHAFVTGPNGVGMTDLHVLMGLPGDYSEAVDINNSGQVLVHVLIPEPASYTLMLAGLAAVWAVVRRKNVQSRGRSRIS
jgi:probable HAF family extracellular repeat protein